MVAKLTYKNKENHRIKMTSKGTIGFLPLIAIVIVGIIVAQQGGLFSVSGFDTNVYCQDYEFICAGQQLSSSVDNAQIGGGIITCNSDRCVISNVRSSSSGNFMGYYIASNISNCGTGFFGEVTCSPEFTQAAGSTATLKLGDRFYTKQFALSLYSMQRYDAILKWCGDAACDAGVTGIQVFGADKNTFITDKSIYSSSGSVLRSPQPSGISYTVPTGQCILSAKSQFICGSKLEQCTTDTDCTSGHTFIVDGKGAEARTGVLDIYGCRSSGTAPSNDQLNILPSESVPTYNYGNKCIVIETRNVQCTTDASCGSNAFCDTKTFTCVSSGVKECMQDYQCGTAVKYDQPTKELRQPACLLNKCSYNTLQKIECYYNSECATGYYCDQTAGYKCIQSTQPKQPAPIECSVGDPRYFDKPAPEGKVCCPSGRVADNEAACSGEPQPTDNCGFLGLACLFNSISIFLLIILAIIVAYVISKFVK